MANKVLKSLKVSAETHHEIKIYSAAKRVNIEVLVEQAWRAFLAADASTTKQEALAPRAPSVNTLEGNRTDSQSGPVLQKISIGTGSDFGTWEYGALAEILDSGCAVPKEAIQKNLTAFRELVRRISADERPDPPDERPESLPGGEVAAVHRRVGQHEQTYRTEKANLPRPSNPGKGKRKPAEGTA